MNYNINNTHSRKQGSLIFSIKFWVLTLLLVFLYSAIVLAQNTVYIDPTNSGDPGQDGSVDNPWDSWTKFSIENNSVYLMKKGTSETLTGYIYLNGKTNVKISTYGTGERPYLYQGTSNTNVIKCLNSSYCEIEGLKMEMPIGMGSGVITIDAHGDGNSAYYNYVRDCEVIGGWRGISSEVFLNQYNAQIGNLYIYDCHIYDQTSDGIFAKTNFVSTYDTIVIAGCNIHDCNLKWFTDPVNCEGDPIHLLRCNNFLVENNILDKRSTANKFCFVWNGGTFDNEKGIVRFNTMYPPFDHPGYSSNAVLIGSKNGHALDSLFFYGNRIIGREMLPGDEAGAIGQIKSSYADISYNIFDGMGYILFSYDYGNHFEVNNNLFRFTDFGTSHVLSLGNVYSNIRNNIFLMPNGTSLSSNGSLANFDNNIDIYSDNLQGFDNALHFANINNYDFHLTENSTLARNQGIEYPNALGCDADSITVPMEGVRDIGVYEYYDSGQTNSPPQIVNQSFSIDENSSNGTAVGTILATDPDAGQTLTFSIESGNTSNAFQINSSTGELTVNNSSVLDFEITPSYSLIVMVEDNGMGTLTDQATITITLNDINENPNIEDQAFNLNENSPPGTQVGSVIATDPDNGQSLTYSIISGNVDDTFVLESSTGLLSLSSTAVLDFNVTPVYNLAVEVEDDGTGSLSSQAMITVNIFSTNEPPVIEEQLFSIDENSSNGTTVGTVLATDPDAGQSLTYSIEGGNTSNAFQINSTTGVLSVNNSAALDYETTPSFSIIVMVEDNGMGTLSDQATITVTLIDVNETPNIEDQSFNISENSPPGVQVGSVVATDPDNGQSLTYTIISGNVDDTFVLDSSSGLLSLSSTAVIDFNVTPVYNLAIEVEDDGTGNLSSQAMITVNVISTNEPPVIEEQTFNLDENATSGSVVGTIEATDPDNGQTLIFSILSGNTDNAFSVDPNTGELMVDNSSAIDFETNPLYSLVVEVEDNGPGNLTSQAVITVILNDLNEDPNIEDQTFSVYENSPNGLELGTVIASDPDVGQALTYTIISGNNNNTFSVGVNTGRLIVANSSAINFEVIPEFTLVVEVEDNGNGNLTDQATITITVNDVNEPPAIGPQNFTIDENSSNTTQVGTVQATDPDNGQALTYSIISGNMANAFVIEENTGILSISNSTVINFEVFPSFVITVEVEDNGTGNLSSSAQITVNLMDVNEAPMIQGQTLGVDVDATLIQHEINGIEFEVGLVIASDPDDGQSVSYTIVEGNEKNIWSMDANTGQIKLVDPYQLYTNEINNFPLTVEVVDDSPEQLTASADVMIHVNIYSDVYGEENGTTSIENNIEWGYSIYPNPATSYLKFDLENVNADPIQVTVTNLNGETVFQQNYTESSGKLSRQIDLNGLSDGMYIIYFQNGNMMKYDKFIKL